MRPRSRGARSIEGFCSTRPDRIRCDSCRRSPWRGTRSTSCSTCSARASPTTDRRHLAGMRSQRRAWAQPERHGANVLSPKSWMMRRGRTRRARATGVVGPVPSPDYGPRASMEPSRDGAADACRVVRRLPVARARRHHAREQARQHDFGVETNAERQEYFTVQPYARVTGVFTGCPMATAWSASLT